ncbi:MAG TPA: TetR/AcrR family transcriptional regulator [Pseudonocardia sp.]|nr:TetR/AcrR family transcriptional regulator [Pseudonocardia sp.]
MPRLTRAESRARTQKLLLATAKRLFLRDGYPAASVEAIAETAGFSRGAVYSAFGSKERLCMAVLEDIYTDEISAIAKALGSPGTLEQRLDAFEEWANRMIGAEGWTTLSVEFASAARRDPELLSELVAQYERVREMIAAVFSYQAHALGLNPALAPEAMGTAVFSLLIGLGLQRLVDPEISVRVAVDAARALLDPTHSHPSSSHPNRSGPTATTSRDPDED